MASETDAKAEVVAVTQGMKQYRAAPALWACSTENLLWLHRKENRDDLMLMSTLFVEQQIKNVLRDTNTRFGPCIRTKTRMILDRNTETFCTGDECHVSSIKQL